MRAQEKGFTYALWATAMAEIFAFNVCVCYGVWDCLCLFVCVSVVGPQGV